MPVLIPRTDSEYLAWSAGYVHRITAKPARYRIDDDDVTLLGELQADFAEKLYLAKCVETRSPRATLEKNQARRMLERAVRHTAGSPYLMLHHQLHSGTGASLMRAAA